MATVFTVDGATPEPEFTARVDLRSGDLVEIRVNGVVQFSVKVDPAAEFDAVIAVSGNARTA